VREEAWADKVDFGPLGLTDVPVAEATPAEVALGGENYEGDLGLAALKRLDLIVDGKGGLAYLRVKETTNDSYRHNRLGAVFVPKTQTDTLLAARVVDGSPAHEAGVQNGDLLMAVNGTLVTMTNYEGYRWFSGKAGTKIKLKLSRNGEIFEATATLRDILSPGTNKK
jgi:S1-C subfamily serine protease